MDNVYSAPFLEPRPEGLFIYLEMVDTSKVFFSYVNDLFRDGYYFRELDYETFHSLLYDLENLKDQQKRVLLAKEIGSLSPERKPLFSRFKIEKDVAYYEFGPIYIKNEEGGPETEARITFDELVAAAWGNQIRFGLAAAEIQQRIKRDFRGMGPIAMPVLPVKGTDARLEYLVKIEKDLTPFEDPKTGRLDLKRCKCSFPQIPNALQCKIVRKYPSTKGTPGFHLNGTMVPPKAGIEIDLKGRAGEGTELITENECEYLCATSGGYVAVNPRNHKISVTLSPENHSPIGPETGSLDIRTDNFTQHGGILNGYSVRCRSINVADGNVSGEIISEEGEIEIQDTVSKGRLIARNGSIKVKGFVSLDSYLESLKGDIVLETAENSTLIGKNVSVNLAVNCNIIGESITINTVRSSKIRGLSILIQNAEPSGAQSENTDIVIPILEMTDKRIRSITQILEEKKTELADLEKKITDLKENQILQAYLQALKAKNETAIKMLKRHATPIANEISELTKAEATCRTQTADIEKKLNALKEEHAQSVETLQKTQQCVLANPGDTHPSLKIYGGLDWPLHLAQLAGGDETAYQSFLELVNNLTSGMSNYKRRGCAQLLTEPCNYDHFALLKLYEKAQIFDPSGKRSGTDNLGKEDLKECRINVITEEDFRSFTKERKWPPRKSTIEVTIDGIFKGYVYDFSTSELSMFVEKGQRWRPAFEMGEKLKLLAVAFGNELKYDLIVSEIEEKFNYFLVLGNFINISTEDEDKLYKLKNRYEVLRKSSG
ncbi:MAG: FapA family protein [Deltaproteobacteria bacterium]|nr:FapA family protein [Deltaproteobacteria bacterium]